MAKTVTVTLPEPIDGHEGPITKLVFRQPTYDEYIECGGEPYTIGQTPEGVLFSTEKPDVIWAYAKTCLEYPKDSLILETQGAGSWRVAREVRKTILGFFQESDATDAPSGTSPTTSSSSSTSPSTPSVA